MALYTGLKFPQKLAGIIALSGYLPLSEEFEKYTFKPNLKTPIFFGHGLLDEIVKPEWGRASERLLKDLGYEPNWNEYKIDHSICLEEILDFSVFINQMLNP